VRRTGLAIWGFLALSGIGIGCFSVADNLYFHDKGYSTAAIGGLVATFNVAVAITEIPAAIVFDRKSHGLAIQVGNLVRTIALILFFLSLGIIGDLVAEALAGAGAAAMSGTTSAYVLNRLSGEPGDQRRALARIAWLGSVSSLVGGLVGVGLFTAAPRAIWLGGAVCMAAAGLVFLVGRHSAEGGSHAVAEPLAHYARGLAAIAVHPRAWASILADAALIGPLILWQLRLGSASIGAVLLGFVVMKSAGVLGGRLLGGRRIPRGLLPLLVATNLVAISAFALSSATMVIVASFGIHVVAHVAISVYCSAQFQHVVPANRRAGASSVVSLLASGLTALAAGFVGMLADEYSAFAAMVPSMLLYVSVVAVTWAGNVRFRGKRGSHSEEPALLLD